jgi:hypothetical protein
MKNMFILFLVLVLIFCCFNVLLAQDITAFEVIDNESIGLTVAPYEKWGMAVSDIDRNGYPDILCVRWKGQGYSRIYLNNEGVFQEITHQTSITAVEAEETNTRGTLWVDYDNDGDRDLSLVTDKEIHLFRNDNNIFTEVSEEVGFVGYIPPGFIPRWWYNIGGWADYDLDGDLDCAITQDYNERMYLFRNDDGQFTNVSAEVGLDSTGLALDYRFSWYDFDLDGDPDLYGRPYQGMHNMYRNDNGVFTEVSAELGLNGVEIVTHREFFDYDNDGDLDFFKAVSNSTWPENIELWGNSDGFFTDMTDELGLTIMPDFNYTSISIGDYENDGDKDIYLCASFDMLDAFLLNEEVGENARVFADVAEFIGIIELGDRKGSACLDYDRDGFLDIYVPSADHNHILYHNVGGNNANWIGFILEGTISNRDAVGSLVTLYTGDKKQIYYTTCGNDFMRQDNPWVHFGIGYETGVDSVVIRWPLGYKQVLTDVAINQYHDIKEPDYSSVESKQNESLKPNAFQLFQNYPNPFNPTTTIKYSIPENELVKLTVYNTLGFAVAKLVNNEQAAGSYSVTWDAMNAVEQSIPSGVYFFKLEAGAFTQVNKMMFLQ